MRKCLVCYQIFWAHWVMVPSPELDCIKKKSNINTFYMASTSMLHHWNSCTDQVKKRCDLSQSIEKWPLAPIEKPAVSIVLLSNRRSGHDGWPCVHLWSSACFWANKKYPIHRSTLGPILVDDIILHGSHITLYQNVQTYAPYVYVQVNLNDMNMNTRNIAKGALC
jgi:hypothetical protein